MSSVIVPSIRYQDAPKAIEFLKDAFGFEENLVVPGEGDIIERARRRQEELRQRGDRRRGDGRGERRRRADQDEPPAQPEAQGESVEQLPAREPPQQAQPAAGSMMGPAIAKILLDIRKV